MRQTVIWVGLACGFSTPASATPDGLLHRLPEDGAWVRYNVTVLDVEGEVTGNMILRSVGRTSVEGRDCRWIEFRIETDRYCEVTKLLIPESYLQNGQNPLDHIVRGWHKLGDLATRKLDKGAGIGLLTYLLTPPLVDSKELNTSEVVEWAHGRLKCAVQVGRLQLRAITPSGRRREEKVRYELGYHEEIPFGVAMTRLAISIEREGEWQQVTSVTIAVADVGRDARSQLPEFQ